MAIIYPPGSILGPCTPHRIPNPVHPERPLVGTCDDLACEHDRWTAAQQCPECREPIGYDRPFTIEPWDNDAEGNPVVVFHHSVCLALAVEASREVFG